MCASLHPCWSRQQRLSTPGATAWATIPHTELYLSWHTGILPLVCLQVSTEHLRAGLTVSIPSRALTWELSHFTTQPDHVSTTEVSLVYPKKGLATPLRATLTHPRSPTELSIIHWKCLISLLLRLTKLDVRQTFQVPSQKYCVSLPGVGSVTGIVYIRCSLCIWSYNSKGA